MLRDAKYRVITGITAKNAIRTLFQLGSSIQSLNFEVAKKDMAALIEVLGIRHDSKEISQQIVNISYREIMSTARGSDGKQVINGCYITKLAEVDKTANRFLVKILKEKKYCEITCAIWLYDACDDVVYFEPEFEPTEIIVQTFPDSRLLKGST